MLDKIKNGLVVSCQALDDEPLHSSYIMSKMALAAYEGGAKGIRANSREDIVAIKQEVDLPVIGIVKRDYANSSVFITATQREVAELISSGCDMIAMDATTRKRPQQSLEELVTFAKQKYIPLMADISTLEEAQYAQSLGFDCISTTLYGYTEETMGHKLFHDDFAFLKTLLHHISIPVIAEGNVLTPEMYQTCMELGAYSCVVGGAITPKRYHEAICSVKRKLKWGSYCQLHCDKQIYVFLSVCFKGEYIIRNIL